MVHGGGLSKVMRGLGCVFMKEEGDVCWPERLTVVGGYVVW